MRDSCPSTCEERNLLLESASCILDTIYLSLQYNHSHKIKTVAKNINSLKRNAQYGHAPINAKSWIFHVHQRRTDIYY